MTAEMRWLRSPKVGVVSLSVRKQMSYSASLSSTMHSSAFSTSWCTDSVALYGSTTVSDTCARAWLGRVAGVPRAGDARSLRQQSSRVAAAGCGAYADEALQATWTGLPHALPCVTSTCAPLSMPASVVLPQGTRTTYVPASGEGLAHEARLARVILFASKHDRES